MLTASINERPDECTSMYLQDIGTRPVLRKDQEHEITHKMARLRRSYRRGLCYNLNTLKAIVHLFEPWEDPRKTGLERIIDTIPSENKIEIRIKSMIPNQLRKLRQLFNQLDRTGRGTSKAARRRYLQQLRQGVDLVEALAPKLSLLEQRHQQASALPVHPAHPSLKRLAPIIKQRHHKWVDVCNKLVGANLRLAINIAKKFRGRGVEFCDLIQEANIGLLVSLNKYDPGLGWKFGTYATWWIRQAIGGYLQEKARLIKVPRTASSQFGAIDYQAERFFMKHERDPLNHELAAATKLHADDLKDMLRAHNGVTTLDHTSHIADDHCPRNQIPDHRPHSEPDEQAALREKEHYVKCKALRVLQKLDRRERDIIRRRFGLGGRDEQTQRAISKVHKISHERVRQIADYAMKVMRRRHDPEEVERVQLALSM